MSHIREVPEAWKSFLSLEDTPVAYAAAGHFTRINTGGDEIEFTDDVVQKTGSSMSGFLTLSADPTNSLHAATKQYVDSVAQGLDVKESVRAATTGAITLSNEQTIDGVDLIDGDRVLVKNQGGGASDAANGIYVVVDLGAWIRATDADEDDEVTAGLFVFVEEGTLLEDTGWVLITDDPITVGSTALEFAQFSGAGTYSAGVGLILDGSQFKADFEDTSGNIQAVGTQAAGTSDKIARADHVHALGNQLGGTLHADVIAGGADGFMIGSDKTKLDLYPASLTGGGFLMANAGGTAVDEVHHTAAQGEILFAAASGVWSTLAVGVAGQVLSSGGAGANVTWADVATTFVGLTDVDEADYTGHAGWLVRVNSTPDGLEFVNAQGIVDGTVTGNTLYWNGTAWVQSGIIFNDHANAEVGINTQAPNSTLEVDGSFAANLATYTATTDLGSGTNGDARTILVSNAAATTITLPAASGLNGREYNIKKISATGGPRNVTIDGASSESIDGDLDIVLNKQYEAITVICDGSNWFIV